MDVKINDLLEQSGDRVDTCIAFAWLWLATADGVLDPNAHAVLIRHFQEIPDGLEKFDLLLNIIAADHLDSFLEVSRILRSELDEEQKDFFLNTAVSISVAAGPTGPSANHILRLYCDLLGYSPDHLYEIYREQANRELPEPGDLSSVQWWQARERRRSRVNESRRRYENVVSTGFGRTEACAVLGLGVDAPRGEIKRAYRRLVQNYHPDRFATMEPDAREVAVRKFLRVQQAYEVLSQ